MDQKGVAPLVMVVLVALVAVVILKVPQFFKNQVKKNPVSSQLEVKEEKSVPSKVTFDPQRLNKYLVVEAALLGITDNFSLYFKDLTRSQEVSIEPTRSWIPASTIKAYVALEAFRQRNLGIIDFNQQVSIKPENIVPTELETDEFPILREGTTVTIKQLVEAMIVQSDNIAYNTLLDILDRRNINSTLKNISITETVVGEKLNLDSNQFEQDLAVPGRQPNTTTVKDLASFFDLLYRKNIPNVNEDEVISVFKRQKINNMIPALLPQNIVVAHKTGDWAPIYHDGGLVFKPDSPFILAVFTNAGDPSIVSKMAQVAYYQSADVVGRSLSSKQTSSSDYLANKSDIAKISLTADSGKSQVLAEEINPQSKFPQLTASDLGITPQDLNASVDKAKSISSAWITPGSFLYNIKRFWEDKQEQTGSNSQKTRALLTSSRDRLSEVKTLLAQGKIDDANQLLKESEQDLEKATNLAKNDPDKDLLLVQVKQVSDLHFAVLGEGTQSVNSNQKEKLIDNVYSFYQQNHQKVAPVIADSGVANPTQQKPAVGTITQISGNIATLKFDDGSQKQMVLVDDVKVRSFQQNNYVSTSSIQTGDKVAVVGLTNSAQQIIPQFVLKNIPPDLPQDHVGTIIEINPGQNTLKIINKKGQSELIKVNTDTIIKSLDTNVSLAGITAGSQVVVFGTTQNATPGVGGIFGLPTNALKSIPLLQPPSSPTTSPRPSTSASPGSSFSPLASPNVQSANQGVGQTSAGKTQVNVPTTQSPRAVSAPATAPNASVIQLKATSITVVKNASGVKEKVETKHQKEHKTETKKK